MDQNNEFKIKNQMRQAAKALIENNIPADIVPSKEEACLLVSKMISDGEVVRDGGSQSLLECGIYDMLAARQVNFVSHNDASISADERRIHDQEAFSCDTYLLSANAITMDGEIFNVDGNGNRVAAMLYGPKQVIVIAGCNKITKDLNGALQRLETIAAPANCRRLQISAPCLTSDHCMHCKSVQRICCDYVCVRFQRTQRIRVILVEEKLGF